MNYMHTRTQTSPNFNLHPLKGSDKDQWSVWVNGNWRIYMRDIFRAIRNDWKAVSY